MEEIKAICAQIVSGYEKNIEYIVAALLCEGNIILNGVPGVAKTLTAKVISKVIGQKFARIQFTPDLMPSDITGMNVYNNKTQEFDFVPGPVFANIILADEINRAPARTQAALLQVMEEKEVTVDNNTFQISGDFMILATQNPVEFEGTYRLPEAVLDRFTAEIDFDYPSREEEIQLLTRTHEGTLTRSTINSIQELQGATQRISKMKESAQQIVVDEKIIEYLIDVINASRKNAHLKLGASPRAAAVMLKFAKALAVLRGFEFVGKEIMQESIAACLPHRWVLKAEAEIQGITKEVLLRDLFKSVELLTHKGND